MDELSGELEGYAAEHQKYLLQEAIPSFVCYQTPLRGSSPKDSLAPGQFRKTFYLSHIWHHQTSKCLSLNTDALYKGDAVGNEISAGLDTEPLKQVGDWTLPSVSLSVPESSFHHKYHMPRTTPVTEAM